MTHLYTRAGEYALRALRIMALEPDRYWPVHEICELALTPEPFTRKVLQALVRSRVLLSSRGPGGGFAFAREPEEITLADVVESIESGPRFDLCILGFQDCSEKNPCALHHLWGPIKDSALRMLRERTISDLTKEPKRKKRKAAKKRRKKRTARRVG